jgi:REP element-mobilizing transposase RayT
MVSTTDKKHGKNLRKGRFSEQGRIYLLTCVSHKRQLFFSNFSCARLVVQALIQEQPRAATLCFVLMPDHLHWLIQLQQDLSLSTVMQSIKSKSSHKINRLLGRTGKVWQPGYHDHALRREEDVKDIARYIIANPIRAGLVASVMDYPHWDAVWLEGK